METVQGNNRLKWIDLMKSMAMYCIIAGHMFPPGNEYLYVFSVPCFFIISGFLSKKYNEKITFWRKIWFNLIVPVLIMFPMIELFFFLIKYVNGTAEINTLWQSPLLSVIGMQGENYSARCLVALWFVYTLVICKIILQFIPDKGNRITLSILSVFCLIGAWLLHHNDIVLFNSWTNVLLAMPFFTIGYLARPLKNRLSNLTNWKCVILFVGGVIVIWICGTFNSPVMLYKCSFGDNILLCLLGGIAGTVTIYTISVILRSKVLDNLSVVLGGGLY